MCWMQKIYQTSSGTTTVPLLDSFPNLQPTLHSTDFPFLIFYFWFWTFFREKLIRLLFLNQSLFLKLVKVLLFQQQIYINNVFMLLPLRKLMLMELIWIELHLNLLVMQNKWFQPHQDNSFMWLNPFHQLSLIHNPFNSPGTFSPPAPRSEVPVLLVASFSPRVCCLRSILTVWIGWKSILWLDVNKN